MVFVDLVSNEDVHAASACGRSVVPSKRSAEPAWSSLPHLPHRHSATLSPTLSHFNAHKGLNGTSAVRPAAWRVYHDSPGPGTGLKVPSGNLDSSDADWLRLFPWKLQLDLGRLEGSMIWLQVLCGFISLVVQHTVGT